MEEQRNIGLGSKIDSSLIRLLGLSVYGDCRKYWNSLETGEQIRLCGEANRYGLGPYFYWALRHDLPERVHDRFKAQYTLRSAAAMKNQQGLTRLYDVFEKEHIRFAPMKGIDLAYRHYPSPALRWFGDWDILFHPDDCNGLFRRRERADARPRSSETGRSLRSDHLSAVAMCIIGVAVFAPAGMDLHQIPNPAIPACPPAPGMRRFGAASDAGISRQSYDDENSRRGRKGRCFI